MSTKSLSKTSLLLSNAFSDEVIAFISDNTTDFAFQSSYTQLTVDQLDALEAQIGLSLPTTINISQVHSNRVLCVDDNFIGPQEADATITKSKNVALLIRTADCVPAFIYDSKNHAIGLVHAGWKGTQKKILIETIKLMEEKFKSKPEELKIALGPCIRSCCYEVDESFLLDFPLETVERHGRCFLDLSLVNRDQALEAGVSEDNIFDCEVCTCCDKNYFSYRRDGERSGRMISLMMLKK